jgi:hypothetical protein
VNQSEDRFGNGTDSEAESLVSDQPKSCLNQRFYLPNEHGPNKKRANAQGQMLSEESSYPETFFCPKTEALFSGGEPPSSVMPVYQTPMRMRRSFRKTRGPSARSVCAYVRCTMQTQGLHGSPEREECLRHRKMSELLPPGR